MVAITFSPTPAATTATTWYVDGNSGSDTAGCSSASTPCRAFQAAIDRAASGDTILAAGNDNGIVYTFAAASACTERYGANVHDVEQSDVAMSLWIRDHVSPEAVIAAQDVGAIGFLTPNPLIDLTGIVTPENPGSIEGRTGGRARAACRWAPPPRT